MSEVMTSDFFYAPRYQTQCVLLNAQAADVPRGTIICAKGAAASISASATFTGTQAALSGDAENYTPAGDVEVTVSESGGVSADGTFDIIGAENYGTIYGVLLKDVKASGSAQSADIVVIGELFRGYINAVYKAANSDNDLPEAALVALRNIGIILK